MDKPLVGRSGSWKAKKGENEVKPVAMERQDTRKLREAVSNVVWSITTCRTRNCSTGKLLSQPQIVNFSHLKSPYYAVIFVCVFLCVSVSQMDNEATSELEHLFWQRRESPATVFSAAQGPTHPSTSPIDVARSQPRGGVLGYSPGVRGTPRRYHHRTTSAQGTHPSVVLRAPCCRMSARSSWDAPTTCWTSRCRLWSHWTLRSDFAVVIFIFVVVIFIFVIVMLLCSFSSVSL